MKATLRHLAKELLPPVLRRRLRGIAGGSRWSGDYADWQSASAAASGYHCGEILERVRGAAAAVRDGAALWERDSVCFHHEEYNWNLVACLMSVAAACAGSLHVLDFGGALGSSYFQHRKLLELVPECTWSVVEQRHFVDCGRSEFAGGGVEFFASMEQCLERRAVNVFLFSSVLQYMEDPYQLLEKVRGLSPAAIIVDRTPFAPHGERITVQRVPRRIYQASYACRFLDRSRVENILRPPRVSTPWFSNSFDPEFFSGFMSYLPHAGAWSLAAAPPQGQNIHISGV